MWMLLRRRRSNLLLLLLLMLASVVYLTYKADEMHQSVDRDEQSEDNLVRQMFIDDEEMEPATNAADEEEAADIKEDLAVTGSEVKENRHKGRRPRKEEEDSEEKTWKDIELGLKESAETVELLEPKLPEDKTRVHLLILAYMRTGSSMTGRILQYSPDVFYWYEPLHELERYYVTGGNISSNYRNLTMNEMFKASAMASGNVSAALNCDMAKIYKQTLLYYFMTFGTYGTRKIHPCFTAAKDFIQWDECIQKATLTCRQSFKATAVKSIRLHMSRALELMKRDPKVKVVHLVRDPRAVLLSRHNLGFADFRKLRAEAKLLCGKYKEDLDLVPSVGDPLRGRYTILRYEDIAADPLGHTRRLYKLMELKPTQNTLKAIRAMTSFVKKTRECPACPLLPRNSSYVAQDWRLSMSLKDVRVISKECSTIMNILGYRAYFRDEKQLRDLSASAVRSIMF